MKRLDALDIKQPYIALFGSGNSVNALSPQEFDFIKSKAFVITINYAPIRLNGHLNMWSDRKVSDFLNQHYKTNEKNCMFLAQEHRVVGDLKDKVDFYFNRRVEELQGNYTIVWALQLIQRYFPDKTVLLFGVDMYAPDNNRGKWYDRFTDFDFKKRGQRYNVQSKLNQCGQQLNTYVKPDKVINCNPKSHLDAFEKRPWQTVFPLHISHFAGSPLAGAPTHLSNIINKYTNSTSTTILRQGFGKSGRWSNLSWPYDVVKPTSKQLSDAVNKADVVHFHARPYSVSTGKKPCVLQFHTPPRGYRPGKTHSTFNGKKLVIAQYHPRFYTDAEIVPNMIDIWDEAYKPAKKPTDKVVIFFSWASEVRGGWSDKGSAETKRILEHVSAKYGSKVEVIVKNNRPYHECLEAKRNAHICIDECVTGSYHLQSLEGAAAGALTFNNMDAETAGFLQKVTGTETHPFENCALDALYERLCYFVEHPEELQQRGHEARLWMERWYDPKVQVGHFMKAYFNLLLTGSVASVQPTVDVPEIPILQAKDVKPTPPAKATRTAARKPARNRGPVPAKVKQPSAKPTAVKPAARPEKPGRQVVPLTKNDAPGQRKITRKLVRKPVKRDLPAPAEAAVKPISKEVSRIFQPEVGRPIAELKDHHRGEDIYILGTGPSLHRENPDAFKNKVCFGINFAFEVVPHIDWHFAHVQEVYEAMKNHVDPKRLILPETVVPQWYRNPAKRSKQGRVPPNCPEAYVYPIQNPAENVLERKHVSLDIGALMFTWSSTTHSAIHVAAYMGAKRIFLVGMDYRTYPNGRVHFDTHLFPDYGRQDWHALSKHQRGDEWLARQLQAAHGIEVINLKNRGKDHGDMVA